MNPPTSTTVDPTSRPARPDSVRAASAPTGSTARQSAIADSFAACHLLAKTHYENFPVLTRLVPPRDRDAFAALYAFCRTADDAADENETPQRALADLGKLHKLVDHAATRAPDSLPGPYFPAIAHVVQSRNLPAELFHRLLAAFERDQTQNRYHTLEDVIDYCKGSADPVGRLVLLITDHGQHTDLDTLFACSDATCTALQLVNHWQDVARDFNQRNRIYLPLNLLGRHGLTEHLLLTDIRRRCASPAFKSAMRDLCNQTRAMFLRGRRLWPLVNRPVRPVVQLFSLGGESILKAIENQDYDVLRARPALSRRKKAGLVFRAWLAHTTGLDLLPRA